MVKLREIVSSLETSTLPPYLERSREISEASPLRSKQGCGFGFIVRRSKGQMVSALALVEISVIPYLTFALTI